MAKHKKKPAKRSGKVNPDSSTVYISMSNSRNPKATAAALHGMETDSYDMGKWDKEHGHDTMPLSDFTRGFDELNVPQPIKAGIVRANYAVYMDGYNGKAFKSRTICEEVE